VPSPTSPPKSSASASAVPPSGARNTQACSATSPPSSATPETSAIFLICNT